MDEMLKACTIHFDESAVCTDCPYKGKYACRDKLIHDLFFTVNMLKEENKNLIKCFRDKR